MRGRVRLQASTDLTWQILTTKTAGQGRLQRGLAILRPRCLSNVAVKFHTLDSSWGDEKKRAYVRHAAREYSIQRDLQHDRIVRLHDVFEVDADTFATVLEYCSGDDLDLLLRERGRLKENDAKAILLQILSGLNTYMRPYG